MKINLNEEISSPDFKAKLIGVVSHHGSTTNSGHYIAHVKSEISWFCCNDGVVSTTEFANFSNSKECYLLFYLHST